MLSRVKTEAVDSRVYELFEIIVNCVLNSLVLSFKVGKT